MRQVFLCAADYTDLPRPLMVFRYGAQNLCRAAWEMMPDIELTVLRGKGRDWQRVRRMQAEGLAAVDSTYIVADDDTCPLAGDWAGFELPQEYAILSAWPMGANINRWTPQHYQPLEDEHYSVGGIRICRQGAMTSWPSMGQSNGYDAIHCEHLRSLGWRVGYTHKLKHHHVGEGIERSTVWTPAT